MTKSYFIFIMLIFIGISCENSKEYNPEGLLKLTEEEIIDRARNLEWHAPNAVLYKDRNGVVMPKDSLRKITDPQEYTIDIYVDDKGTAKEIIYKKATQKDRAYQKKLQQAFEEGPEIKDMNIDCSNVQQILQGVFDNDQQIRTSNTFDLKADHRNLEVVINLIEKCGMPKYDEIGELPFWGIIVALQHSRVKYLKKYYPLLKQEMGVMPIVEDRILMWEGKPQIYGSQISNGKLYDLFEPERVNKRRAEVGLDPLEDYLKRWNIEFNAPQEK